MALIGYMEGTNSDLLSKLVAEGHETLPLGNGTDGHGKYIAHLTKSDGVALIISYFHKLSPISGHPSMDVMLSGCQIHNIPVILIVPEDAKSDAESRLEGQFDCVYIVSPEEVSGKINEILNS